MLQGCNSNLICGCGGIGRRVRFRFLWSQGCAGSSPVTRTKKGKGKFVFPFFFFKRDRAWSRSGSEWQSGGLSEPRTTKPRSPRRESSPVSLTRVKTEIILVFVFCFLHNSFQSIFALSGERRIRLYEPQKYKCANQGTDDLRPFFIICNVSFLRLDFLLIDVAFWGNRWYNENAKQPLIKKSKYICPKGYLYSFCSTTTFLNLVKTQIPSSCGTRYTCLFLVVWRQLEFAFFGAATPVVALFVCTVKK